MAGRNVRSKKTVYFEDLTANNGDAEIKKEVKDVNYNKPPINTAENNTPVDKENIKEPPKAEPTEKETSFHNPFVQKPVEDKNYGTEGLGGSNEQNPNPDQQQQTGRIPEQEFETPPPEKEPEPTIQDTDYEETKDKGSSGGGGGGGSDSGDGGDDNGSDDGGSDHHSGGGGYTQSEETELSPAEKKKATKLLAETILRAYQHYIPEIYRMIGKFSDKKLKKVKEAGRINLNRKIKYPNGRISTVLDEIHQYNQAFDNLAVTDDWIEDLRPHLEEVLAKQKMGLSPEAYLIWKVAEHNVACVREVVAAKNRLMEFLTMQEQETEKDRTRYQQYDNDLHTEVPPTQQQTQPPAQEQQPINDTQQPPTEETQNNTPPPPVSESVSTETTDTIHDEGDMPPVA